MYENNNELVNFESLKIGIASSEKILSWSKGEVTKPETINYRSLKPEPEGLFCEKIFGPQRDWACHCGKYKKNRHKGMVCDKCGVEITSAKVRRERLGHIELATPVSHIWYFKGIPSRMGLILDITPKNLEKILYFAAYIVIEPGDTGLQFKEIIGEQQFRDLKDQYGDSFVADTGAEAVKTLLSIIDVEQLVVELRDELETAKSQKRIKLIRRLEVIEALRQSGNKPEWMIMDIIPVIPPDLRPMVQLDGGRFATSDLNDLYRRVINRNNRLKRLLELKAPDIIVRNEKRMLQEAVDSLIDNGRRGRPVTGPGARPLKSLSDMLKGKQGRFRQNLLGKRADYSGRSVIVVGPELKFYQCGLPKDMALELFKPFIMKRLVKDGDAYNIKNARKMIDKVDPKVWDILDEIIQEHPVMLNRAPTLHRLGIQAFEPILVEGKAIKLHPLVCTAFNADFDGDQMAVHVPLSMEAQAEARFLMLSTNNILAPKDGSPITTPTQDMILGSYYLTYLGEEKDEVVKVFADFEEMLMAYKEGVVTLHSKVKVRCFKDKEDSRGQLVESTVGRFIFNQEIPQDLGFVEDRELDPYSLEVDFVCNKKKLGQIIQKCYTKHGNARTAIMLDYIKDTGFHYSTLGAITIGISDMVIPEEKEELLAEADKNVDQYDYYYKEGLISNEERYERVKEVWEKTTESVSDALIETLGSTNNLFIMADSGARGSKDQIKQIGGMRGLMANAAGKTIEIPIKANFREGLSVLEYFISTNGARKGLADTALRTADSGYLTRRLVDVSHNVIIRSEDCGSEKGVAVKAFTDGKEVIETLRERILGRISLNDISDPVTGEIICAANNEITEEIASKIENAGTEENSIEEVTIRSALTCESRDGVCAMCYGRNLATGKTVNIGEAVGITAAQSIGEPGTQLTMRTFHTGGIAGDDITQGLPRVVELFEARKPKGIAEICEEDGVVTQIRAVENSRTEVVVLGETEKIYTVPFGASMAVSEGDRVSAGDNITKGPLNPHDKLRLNGVGGVYQYLLREVQRVYKLQGVDINDKHIEVIVSQMLSKFKIENAGDTTLLPGALYDRFEIEEAVNNLKPDGMEPEVNRVLLGITKASLATSSFLSAASFQETTKVLTDAAIKGKKDNLVGLKENVIIGKLIPAGTGMKTYRNTAVDYGENKEYIERAIAERRLEKSKAEKEEAANKKNDSAPIGLNSEPLEELQPEESLL